MPEAPRKAQSRSPAPNLLPPETPYSITPARPIATHPESEAKYDQRADNDETDHYAEPVRQASSDTASSDEPQTLDGTL